MPAYVRLPFDQFAVADPAGLAGHLHQRYCEDGYQSQYTQQTKAWEETLRLLQPEINHLLGQRPAASQWTLLLEYPLYRLRRRIDAVILAGSQIVVLEVKVGETRFSAVNRRQVEEYALDLRDFHAGSRRRRLFPVLWCTGAAPPSPAFPSSEDRVPPVTLVGASGLADLLASLPSGEGDAIDPTHWDHAPYRPVPNVIEAATVIFSGHNVRAIAQSDATNLNECASRIVDLIASARAGRRRALIVLTGAPGAGKTLAGLQVVHDAVDTGKEDKGDIVYLSGNTPLVTVLRESLAEDESRRNKRDGAPRPLSAIRRDVRTRIQHINDFLRDNINRGRDQPPHEHAIVFDEAQRAWDSNQGLKKFNRDASEPTLILEIMGRHPDWCACVCLVGGGQEINDGEQGIAGWGDALRQLPPGNAWTVYAPPDVLQGGPSTGRLSLGQLPDWAPFTPEPALQLLVPLRSYGSPHVSEWVDHVLHGDHQAAAAVVPPPDDYPIMLTQSLKDARAWLRSRGRGERRYGLVASSGARRLRADGLGVLLHAKDRNEIAHWYLREPDDIRSSYALEVPANEYTCQGLELDFVGVCWGGDLLHQARTRWAYHRLNGPKWQTVRLAQDRLFIRNSYRVLLTRARQGMIIWVPRGDEEDDTRKPAWLNATAEYLAACGACPVGEA